jgi:hypothetical protein
VSISSNGGYNYDFTYRSEESHQITSNGILLNSQSPHLLTNSPSLFRISPNTYSSPSFSYSPSPLFTPSFSYSPSPIPGTPSFPLANTPTLMFSAGSNFSPPNTL